MYLCKEIEFRLMKVINDEETDRDERIKKLDEKYEEFKKFIKENLKVPTPIKEYLVIILLLLY